MNNDEEYSPGLWRLSVPLPFYGFLHVRCGECGERFWNWRGGKRRSRGTPEEVYQWHYRREHIARDDIQDAAASSGQLRAAGSQLYRAAKIAYDLSRDNDQVMSLGQRDTMFYALKRWEKFTGAGGAT